MAGPGVPGSQVPANLDYLVRRITDLERSVRELGPSIAASFQPVITDLQNKQSQIDAQLAQINALLGAEVAFGSVGVSQSNLAPSSAGGTFGLTSITVPSGFTQVTVLCVVDATIYNTSGSGDYIYLAASINSAGGGENDTWAATGFSTGLSASGIRTMTGLTPGSTFPVGANLRTSSVSMPAQVASKVDVNAIALFLR